MQLSSHFSPYFNGLAEITAVFFTVKNELVPIWEVTFCKRYDCIVQEERLSATYRGEEYFEGDFEFVIGYYDIYNKVLNSLPIIDYYEPPVYQVGTNIYYSKGYKQIAPRVVGSVTYPDTYTIDVVTIGKDKGNRSYIDSSKYSPGSYIVRKYFPEYYDTTGRKLESFYIYNAVEE